MHLLEKESDFPVYIMMNSGGGIWHDALAIYDCIKDFPAPVYISVYGKCMSAAVPIVQACETRFIYPNALVMVHDGHHELQGAVDTRALENIGARSKLERKRMYGLLASHGAKTPAFWRRKCATGDFNMSATDAVKLGLFDGIVMPE